MGSNQMVTLLIGSTALETMKFKIDWNQAPGRVTKTETHVIIHPIDMVSQVHKKKGLDEACALAVELITKKYNRGLTEPK